MDDAYSDKVFACVFLGVAFLNFFLALELGSLLPALLQVGAKFGLPESWNRQQTLVMRESRQQNKLFSSNSLVLYRLFVIWASACRTGTIHIGFDVVEAELADLERVVARVSGCKVTWARKERGENELDNHMDRDESSCR